MLFSLLHSKKLLNYAVGTKFLQIDKKSNDVSGSHQDKIKEIHDLDWKKNNQT